MYGTFKLAVEAVSVFGQDHSQVIQVTTVLIGVLTGLTSLEHLATRDRLTEGGLLDWKVSRLYVLTAGRLAVLVELLVRPPRYHILLYVRFFVGLILATLALTGRVSVVLLLLLFLLNSLHLHRIVGGLTGTFQVSMIVVPALIVAVVAPDGSVAQMAALVFIGLQCALSYSVAGISKVVASEWRNGEALHCIFSTEMYGHPAIYRLLDSAPRLTFVGAWLVIGFEMLFPLALVGGRWVLLTVVTAGLLFHLFNAVFMGLNNFLVGFPVMYPALVYTHEYLASGWI